MSKKREEKTFMQKVADAAKNNKYIKVVAAPGSSSGYETTPVSLTGAKSRPDWVYVSSLRLAGTPADVRGFLAMKTGSPANVIDSYLANAYTVNNITSSAPMKTYVWTADVAGNLVPQAMMTTFAQGYANELAAIAAAKKSKKDVPTAVFSSDMLAQLAKALDDAKPSISVGKGKGKKKTTTTSGAKRGDVKAGLEAARAAGKVYDVTKVELSTAGKGDSEVKAKGARTTEKVPKEGVRLAADAKDMLYSAFFTYKPSTGIVPSGPVTFLKLLGMPADQAAALVNAMATRAAQAAAQAAIPSDALMAAPAGLPVIPSVGIPPMGFMAVQPSAVAVGMLPIRPKTPKPATPPKLAVARAQSPKPLMAPSAVPGLRAQTPAGLLPIAVGAGIPSLPGLAPAGGIPGLPGLPGLPGMAPPAALPGLPGLAPPAALPGLPNLPQAGMPGAAPLIPIPTM